MFRSFGPLSNAIELAPKTQMMVPSTLAMLLELLTFSFSNLIRLVCIYHVKVALFLYGLATIVVWSELISSINHVNPQVRFYTQLMNHMRDLNLKCFPNLEGVFVREHFLWKIKMVPEGERFSPFSCEHFSWFSFLDVNVFSKIWSESKLGPKGQRTMGQKHISHCRKYFAKP